MVGYQAICEEEGLIPLIFMQPPPTLARGVLHLIRQSGGFIVIWLFDLDNTLQ